MSFREKMKLAAPGNVSGPASFSALRAVWGRVFPANRAQSHQNQASLEQDFRKQDCSPDLHGLIDTLKVIRRRILANTFLGGWTVWSTWILIGLIVVGAFSAKLAGWIILAASLAAIGAIAILVWAWRTRLSTYDTACRLDAAVGLKDRVSTAIYLGDAKSPDGMIQRQRGDAVSRLAKVDPRGLFPVRMPAAARRALLLVLVVVGLFVYRMHHKPPLVALLQTTARSSLVQSILSPIVRTMEKDLQRTIALVTLKSEATADEVRSDDSKSSSDDLWQAGDEKGTEMKEGQQDSLDAGDGKTPQDQLQGPGDQDGPPSAESRQDENNGPQSQEGKSGSDSKAGNSQKQSDAQGAQNSHESLSQSLMQALKNMMSNSQNQQSNNRGNQQPQQPNAQGAPQSGDSHQPGTTESDRKSESRGSSDAKEKPSQSASNGAGSQQGTKEMRKDQETHPVTAVPDRVALEASGFKDQTRMRVDTETGTARLAVRDVSPQAEAVINGAEQENIPARYRLYVQRYFEHADNGKQ